MSFEALSRKLRKVRLDKNLRLSELYDKTKIQLESLKKLENGEFEFFPRPVIIGFIKSIAQVVEAKESELIALYYAEFEKAKEADITNQNKDRSVIHGQNKTKIVKEVLQESEEPKESKEKEEPNIEDKVAEGLAKPEKSAESKAEKDIVVTKKNDIKPKKKTVKSKATVHAKEGQKPEIKKSSKPVEKPKSKDKNSSNWFTEHKGEIILGTLVLLIFVGIIYVYVQYISKENVNSTSEPVKKITVFEARQQNLEKVETEKPEIELIRIPEKVKLRVVAVESTWVQMIRDEFDTTEYIFPPGRDRSFIANEKIELRMGRADGLFLWVNSDSIGTLGTAEQIVSRLVLTNQGIIERRVRRPQPPPQQE